jgi:hypothetical protein
LYSEAPLKVEEPPVKFQLESENQEDQGGIDFGDEGEINFGDDSEAINFGEDVDLEVGNIDWGNVDPAAGDANPDINFDISLEESGIVVEGSGNEGGVARGEEAYSLLDSPKYRDKVLDELFELESFLKMRLYELSTNDKIHVISMSLLDGFTDHDAKTVTEMLSYVDIVIASISTSLIQQLFQIKHSAKYVDILASKLKQKLAAIEKLQITQEVLSEKAQEMRKLAIDLKPTLAKILDQTKILQKDVGFFLSVILKQCVAQKTVVAKTVKIFFFKLSKFSFSKLTKFSFSNCQNFPFQTVKIFLLKEYERRAGWCVVKFQILVQSVATQKV